MTASAEFILIAAAALALLLSPEARALTCTSQTFPNNTKYQNCADLPVLKAFLHWTYDAAAKPRPTLAIAFGASPAKPGGYVAWGPNPTGEGMKGAQAFVAFIDGAGAVVVKTYNISSYSSIKEGNITYNVVERSGVSSGDLIWIFGKLALPEWPGTVNHVWQIGGTVNNGSPTRHEFNPDNLNAKAKLELSGNASSPSPTPAPAGGSSAGWRVGGIRVWVYGMLVLLGALAF